MNDISLAYYIKDELDRLENDWPGDVTDLIITEVSPISKHKLKVDSSPTAGNYSWGFLEVTSGNAEHMYFLIKSVSGDEITLMEPMHLRSPEVGDTVRIVGGPLANADVYVNTPPKSMNPNVDCNVIIVSDGATIGKGSLGQNSYSVRQKDSVLATYGYTIFVETKRNYNFTVPDSFRINKAANQVVSIVNTLKQNERIQLRSNDEIEYDFSIAEREGEKTKLDICEISFEMTVQY